MSVSIHPPTDLRVAAFFTHSNKAYQAAQLVQQLDDVDVENVDVIAPQDAHLSAKLAGEPSKLGQKMLRLHLLWGGVGLVCGAIVATLLVAIGPALTQQNPIFTYIALISPGLFTGLLVSGMLSLRPDKDPLTFNVKSEAKQHSWSVVVHLTEYRQRQHVLHLLKSMAPEHIV